MKIDFDHITPRTNTGSIKWEYIDERGQLTPLARTPYPLDEASLLPLALSDMDFPSPQPVRDALINRVQHGIFGYTEPDESYYEAIIGWMGRRHRWTVERDWIITTSGVMQSINLLVQTLTQPGEGIIIQPPVFGPIARAVSLNERVIQANRLLYRSGQYEIDYADLEARAAAPDCKMLILCHPHNPVGRVWRPEELKRIALICREHDLIIISDEIHGEMTYSWAKFVPIGVVDPGLNERLVVCTGPSKAFNLPGMRTSLTIIPEAGIRRQFIASLAKLNELFGVNILGTVALQSAYETGEPWLTQLLVYLEDNYLFLRDFLERELPMLRLVPAEGLYLAWIDCRALEQDEAGLKQLCFDDARVYLEWGSHFGREGEGFVRVNLACPRVILRTALERLRDAVVGGRSG
jgi:cystathionine beta-lyase